MHEVTHVALTLPGALCGLSLAACAGLLGWRVGKGPPGKELEREIENS